MLYVNNMRPKPPANITRPVSIKGLHVFISFRTRVYVYYPPVVLYMLCVCVCAHKPTMIIVIERFIQYNIMYSCWFFYFYFLFIIIIRSRSQFYLRRISYPYCNVYAYNKCLYLYFIGTYILYIYIIYVCVQYTASYHHHAMHAPPPIQHYVQSSVGRPPPMMDHFVCSVWYTL